ncbi:hypothetical protein DEO72_LG2g4052 [Vigna unguiculata]|uniref:Transmembrane protein n=1 Tax=Vigna unguiculata TaxID=3917 RepID=A0A4D6L5H7_VIGUN|nr:hypothetical protein DEO72_LG2g4052 [Vigna unguiculata]
MLVVQVHPSLRDSSVLTQGLAMQRNSHAYYSPLQRGYSGRGGGSNRRDSVEASVGTTTMEASWFGTFLSIADLRSFMFLSSNSDLFTMTIIVPRTVWMSCTQTIMLIVYLLFAYFVSGILYPTVAFLGVCYGVQISVIILTVSEVFVLSTTVY